MTVAAGVAAAIVHRLFGSPWHVLAGAGAMSLDPQALIAILAMTAATFATRIADFPPPPSVDLSPRMRAGFEAIPAAVLVAVVAAIVSLRMA